MKKIILVSIHFICTTFFLDAQSFKSPYPIIFVHGLIGNETTWNSIANFLTNGNPNDMKVFDFCLNDDKDNLKALLSNDTSTRKLGWRNGNYSQSGIYAINFDNTQFPPETGHEACLLSNQSAIYKQGCALGAMIKNVIDKTHASKIILVGHSMGGLAIREYLQRTSSDGKHPWWYNPNDKVDGHMVAKVVTIGTPHLGTNDLSIFDALAGIDFRSEAVRDLRSYLCDISFNCIDMTYLYGGSEDNLIIGDFLSYYNNDINCNGKEDFIIGLNDPVEKTIDNRSMPLPQNIIYTWITSNAHVISDGDGDWVVERSRQWLYSSNISMPEGISDTILIHAKHARLVPVSGIAECDDISEIIRGFDEPNYSEFAYKLNIGQTSNGFITFGTNYGPFDQDFYKVTGQGNGLLQFNLSENYYSGVSGMVIQDSLGNQLAKQSGNLPYSLKVPDITQGKTIYVVIQGTAYADSYENPYTLSISSLQLYNGFVTPSAGSTLDQFMFSVTYKSIPTSVPQSVKLIVDNYIYPMTNNSSDWSTGVIYSYLGLLSVAHHSYHFEAIINDNIKARYPSSGELYFDVSTPSSGPISLSITPNPVILGQPATIIAHALKPNYPINFYCSNASLANFNSGNPVLTDNASKASTTIITNAEGTVSITATDAYNESNKASKNLTISKQIRNLELSVSNARNGIINGKVQYSIKVRLTENGNPLGETNTVTFSSDFGLWRDNQQSTITEKWQDFQNSVILEAPSDGIATISISIELIDAGVNLNNSGSNSIIVSVPIQFNVPPLHPYRYINPGNALTLSYSPVDDKIAFACPDWHIRVYDISMDSIVYDLGPFNAPGGTNDLNIYKVRYSPNGSKLLIMGNYGAKIINSTDGTLLAQNRNLTLSFPEGDAKWLDNNSIIAGYLDYASSNSPALSIINASNLSVSQNLFGSSYKYATINVCPNYVLVSFSRWPKDGGGHNEGNTFLLSRSSWGSLWDFNPAGNGSHYASTLSSDGTKSIIYDTYTPKNYFFIDNTTGSTLGSMGAPWDVWNLASNPKYGDYIASFENGTGENIQIINVNNYSIKSSSQDITCSQGRELAWSNDGEILSAASDDGRIALFAPFDNSDPSIMIVNPDYLDTYLSTVKVSGSVTDDRAISRVRLKNNNGSWINLSLLNDNFSQNIQLVIGQNTIVCEATDLVGKKSTKSIVVNRIGIPEIPVLVLPIANSINNPTNIDFLWHSSNYAINYHLQIAEDTLFSNIIYEDSEILDTFQSVAGLKNNIKYFWRVNASNNAGISLYSEVAAFKTIVAVPNIPIPNFPQQNIVVQSDSVTFQWSRTSDASTYMLQVASDQSFSDISINNSTLLDTSLSTSDLITNHQYFWRVRASNLAGISEYSITQSFNYFKNIDSCFIGKQKVTIIKYTDSLLINAYVFAKGVTESNGPTDGLYVELGLSDDTLNQNPINWNIWKTCYFNKDTLMSDKFSSNISGLSEGNYIYILKVHYGPSIFWGGIYDKFYSKEKRNYGLLKVVSPKIDINKKELNIGYCAINSHIDSSIAIYNVGSDTLEIDSANFSNIGFNVSSISVKSILPGDSIKVYFRFSPMFPGRSNSYLRIYSNSPKNADSCLITGYSPYYVSLNKSICNGESYNSHSTSGNYIDTLITSSNCDSIVTTLLTVYPSYFQIDNINICNGASYKGHTISDNYIEILQTIDGCDSIISTNLTVNPLYSITVDTTICDGNYKGYNTSGKYIENLITVSGCDSIVTTNLIVNPVFIITKDTIICGGSYKSHNITGTYIENLKTILGCDSIITINLIVNPTYSGTEDTIICGGSYKGHNTTGTYIENLKTISGCDSIITTNLIVNPDYIITRDTIICGGSYKGHNTTGTYIENLKTVSGCDSIVTTNLILNPDYIITRDTIICGGSYKGHNITGTYIENLKTVSGCDSIVTTNLILNPDYIITRDTIICGGSYKGHNTTGTYIENLKTVSGCDSIVKTNLTINLVYSIIEDTIICGVSFKGHYSSGTFMEKFKTAAGCDSIITTNLTLNPIYRITLDKVICGGSYNGHTVTGTYTENLQSISGCDSIVETQLVVNPVYNRTDNISICHGSNYRGFNTSGTFIENLKTVLGCDSILTINLKVNPHYNIEVDKVICGGSYNGHYISGKYIDTLNSISGCDSIVETNLQVNPDYNRTDLISICQGSNYKGLTTAGIYIERLKSILGCDSVITTDLSVHTIPGTPTIILMNGVLKSNATMGNQWYFNDTVIQDAFNDTYIPSVKGNYYSIVTLNSCSSIASNNISFLTEIQNYSGSATIEISPNPTSGIIEIKAKDAKHNEYRIAIYNNLGTLIQTALFKMDENQVQINLSSFPSGAYIVLISNKSENCVFKIVKF